MAAEKESQADVWFFSNNNSASQRVEQLLLDNGITFDKWEEGVHYNPDSADPIIAPEIMGRYGHVRGEGGAERFVGLWNSDPRRQG